MNDKIKIVFEGKTYYYFKDELYEFLTWQNKVRNLAFRFDSEINNQ